MAIIIKLKHEEILLNLDLYLNLHSTIRALFKYFDYIHIDAYSGHGVNV